MGVSPVLVGIFITFGGEHPHINKQWLITPGSTELDSDHGQNKTQLPGAGLSKVSDTVDPDDHLGHPPPHKQDCPGKSQDQSIGYGQGKNQYPLTHPIHSFGDGSKFNSRGKPQVLATMFPLTRATHFGIPVFLATARMASRNSNPKLGLSSPLLAHTEIVPTLVLTHSHFDPRPNLSQEPPRASPRRRGLTGLSSPSPRSPRKRLDREATPRPLGRTGKTGGSSGHEKREYSGLGIFAFPHMFSFILILEYKNSLPAF